jgi:hypothetical protein
LLPELSTRQVCDPGLCETRDKRWIALREMRLTERVRRSCMAGMLSYLGRQMARLARLPPAGDEVLHREFWLALLAGPRV